MKIKYNILWIDDLIDEFIEDGHIKNLEDYLKEEGFEPIIDTDSNPTSALDKVSNSFDLILTDFNMAGMNGKELIQTIRSRAIYTEVLFYTAEASLPSLHQIDRISFLQTAQKKNEGTHHNIVEKEAKRLISLTIAKFQSIVAMRGLIMHETSILDARIDQLVRKYLSCRKTPCPECDNLKKCETVFSPILRKMEASFCEKIKIIKSGNFKKIQNDNFLYSAYYKMLVLSELLKEERLEDFTETYRKEIIGVRNKFAHAVLKEDGGKHFLGDKAECLEFNSDFCKKIRKNIRKYQQILETAEKAICQPNETLL